MSDDAWYQPTSAEIESAYYAPAKEAVQQVLSSAQPLPFVDMKTFGQLLDIDDDESHEFSKSLVDDYIQQSDAIWDDIRKAIEAGDNNALSNKCHFLKGSSAALGLQRLHGIYRAMQNFGSLEPHVDEISDIRLSKEEAVLRCKLLMAPLVEERAAAQQWLDSFYNSL